ncbi:MAG TPA: hypothetical protein VFB72_00900 [Verrucomicrobiae bacterium]|nr:hypothetical protein [Verrucomicrobiae bacterium]
MKKVNIGRNVIIGGRILKKGETHEVSDEHADILIKGEHAVAHTPAPAPDKTETDEKPPGDDGKKKK